MTLDAAERARKVRDGHAAAQMQAVEHMTKKYEAELRGKK